MIDSEDLLPDELEQVRMLACANWRAAQALAEQLIHKRNRIELPQRVARMKSAIQRFAPQIAAQGVDPETLMAEQETDLMRAGVYTNPLFTRALS